MPQREAAANIAEGFIGQVDQRDARSAETAQLAGRIDDQLPIAFTGWRPFREHHAEIEETFECVHVCSCSSHAEATICGGTQPVMTVL